MPRNPEANSRVPPPDWSPTLGPIATSDRLGWRGVSAHRIRGAPTNEYSVPSYTAVSEAARAPY